MTEEMDEVVIEVPEEELTEEETRRIMDTMVEVGILDTEKREDGEIGYGLSEQAYHQIQKDFRIASENEPFIDTLTENPGAGLLHVTILSTLKMCGDKKYFPEQKELFWMVSVVGLYYDGFHEEMIKALSSMEEEETSE